mgnify:CR=1 FL=1
MPRNEDFFLARREQSYIKAKIVSQYFWIWAKVMAERAEQIYYVDLFSGPGKYEDGAESTPLLIMKGAIRDPKISATFRTFFNDENRDYINQLQIEIESLEGYSNLKYKPVFSNKDVSDIKYNEVYSSGKIIPTLLFIDPFGYSGLSVDLVNTVKSWGCEIIFFFNYLRINMALSNPVFVPNMKKLFGESLFSQISDYLNNEKFNPEEREQLVTEAVCHKISAIDPNIIKPLHYRFRDENGTRITHHLFFATKNALGYAKMKEIMARQSSEIQEGVGMMEYNLKTKYQPRLIIDTSIPHLMNDLTNKFAGKTLTVQQVYFQDNIGRPYVEKNYKDALRALEANGRITMNPPKDKRKKIKGLVTVADTVLVEFPQND